MSTAPSTRLTVDVSGRLVRVGLAALSDTDDVVTLADWVHGRWLGPDLAAVVSADLHDRMADILPVLRPVLREVVCCDGADRWGGPAPLGADLAWYALDPLGMGQDFVYTVPDLSDGVDFALRVIVEEGSGWTARSVLVMAPGPDLERVRRRLSPGPTRRDQSAPGPGP